MKLLIACASILVAACSHNPPSGTTLVPIPVACQQAEPDRPAMPTESLKPGVDVFTFSKSAAAEIELHNGYEQQLVTALRACITPVVSSRP